MVKTYVQANWILNLKRQYKTDTTFKALLINRNFVFVLCSFCRRMVNTWTFNLSISMDKRDNITRQYTNYFGWRNLLVVLHPIVNKNLSAYNIKILIVIDMLLLHKLYSESSRTLNEARMAYFRDLYVTLGSEKLRLIMTNQLLLFIQHYPPLPLYPCFPYTHCVFMT